MIRLRNPSEHTLKQLSPLAQLRTRAGWTQAKLAKELGVSINTLRRYEEGNEKGYKLDAFVLLWAELLKIEVSTLMAALKEQEQKPKKEKKKPATIKQKAKRTSARYRKLTPIEESSLWERARRIAERDK